jgi:hypothetical protein
MSIIALRFGAIVIAGCTGVGLWATGVVEVERLTIMPST